MSANYDPALETLAQRIGEAVGDRIFERLRAGDGDLVAPEYLTPRQAGRFTGTSPRTLEQLRQAGKGPRFIRLGAGRKSRVRYRVSDLRAWIEQGDGAK